MARRGLISYRTFAWVSLASALILCSIVAIPQWLSKQARWEVLRTHVARVADLAASAVDGDLHRRLLEPENYTPELYEKTLAPLVRFHSAYPDIFYVYTMVERDGRALFVVDTAASGALQTTRSLRASAYMEPFIPIDNAEPDWLQRIASGETYVYRQFQQDHYGNFLSGHAPIYDSQGRPSGFVGVDFDLEYYLDQEADFRAISIGTLITAALMSLLVGYLAARYHYQLQHRIAEQTDISMRDELTQLLNRRGAQDAIKQALSLQSSTYALILVDVDDLKGINDGYGHAAGDDFLIKVAQAIRSSVRDKDICARLGGDEFMIFATGCDLDAATEIARRILTKAYASESISGRSHFGVSIGICIATQPDVNYDNMYRSADSALYNAKSSGRNRYVIYEPAAMEA